MSVDKKLHEICKENGEVKITNIDLTDMFAGVRFPYENSIVGIDIAGDTDEEIVDSFKREVNQRLNEMIDHLENCKLE